MHASLGSEPITSGWVLAQECIPPELVRTLVNHKDVYVRCALAMRRDTTSAKTLERYLYDPSPAALACAAGNSHAPFFVLKKAIESTEWAPRQQACENENLPDELLLPHYKNFGWVEYIVLVNKQNVPAEVLDHILVSMKPDWHFDGKDEWKDWNYYIRNRARRRLGLPKVEGEEETSKIDPTK